ncbi:MAG: hypothetical protein A2V67_12855 [Deltaproteobacteria bacterium RBG_13_61_14]|nr:MAG: hypothetical protein A2V67_12855 [Deltaproteobacteria bacterium RBG_13_61_14]
MSEEMRAAILEVFQKNLKKGKKKLYIKEVVNELPQFPRSEVKVCSQKMLDDGILAYWSSGSTTYLMLKEEFEKYRHEAEDHPEEGEEKA